MGGLDILSIEPHKVSRDLRGVSVMIYGDVKTGKTTNASKFPNPLLLAFEKGYNALPGVMAQPMNTWGDMIKVLRQLESPEAKEMYETVIIDTADIAYELAETYICQVEGVEAIGDIPYGQGFNKLAQEFDQKLRKIVQMNYGLVIISHSADKTFQNEDGSEYNKIVPTLPNRARLITSRMCDIIGYSRQIELEDGPETYLFMRGTPRFEAGSRFKYTSDKIRFEYDELVDDVANAIEKQAKENDGKYVTDERSNLHLEDEQDLTFDVNMERFNEIVEKLLTEDAEKYPPLITAITDEYLGVGRKVNEMTKAQSAVLEIIVEELEKLD